MIKKQVFIQVMLRARQFDSMGEGTLIMVKTRRTTTKNRASGKSYPGNVSKSETKIDADIQRAERNLKREKIPLQNCL